jgi:hypothetical protein
MGVTAESSILTLKHHIIGKLKLQTEHHSNKK